MGALRDLDQNTLKAFETYLGLNADGVYDDELGKRLEAYQGMLGHGTMGQTADENEYAGLVNALQQRHAAFNTSADPTPMQDTAFQAFLRNAGADESKLLDEIRFRTEQTNREINRRAAGFAAQKAESQQAFGTERTAGTKKIRDDYSARGLVGASAQGNEEQTFLTDIGQRESRMLGDLDQQQMDFEAGQRDALSEATRRLRGDISDIYRRRTDEELNARDRVAARQGERTYGG